MTDQEVVTKRVDAEMIQRPHLWPSWPFLFLKKGEFGLDMKFAVITDFPGKNLHLFETPLGLFPVTLGDLRGLKFKVFDSPGAIVSDGWVVD